MSKLDPETPKLENSDEGIDLDEVNLTDTDVSMLKIIEDVKGLGISRLIFIVSTVVTVLSGVISLAFFLGFKAETMSNRILKMQSDISRNQEVINNEVPKIVEAERVLENEFKNLSQTVNVLVTQTTDQSQSLVIRVENNIKYQDQARANLETRIMQVENSIYSLRKDLERQTTRLDSWLLGKRYDNVPASERGLDRGLDRSLERGPH